MKRRLFYIGQYFSPEPYLKDLTFINDLKNKGWDPIVITSFPSYPKGNIYKGYKNAFFKIEILGGIKVIRVLTFPYHGLNAFKKSLFYFTFSFFSSLAIIRYGRPKSLYYVLQSSPFVIFNAWTIRLFKPRSTILLDIQDIFPENIRVSGFIKQKWIIRMIDFLLNHFYYKCFDLFVVVSKSFAKILVAKKINPAKISTLYNWSLVEKKRNQQICPKTTEFDPEFLHIVYAGNIGVHQGLSRLTEAYNKIPLLFPKIKLHFFGDGTDVDSLLDGIKNNPAVIVHGRVRPDEITKYLESADVLFLQLVKDPVYKYIIPSKLQAYIEIGKPILAGLEGEAEKIVLDNQLGETFDPENSEAFLTALIRILKYDKHEKEEIHTISKDLYESVFSREAGVQKLNDFLQSNYEY